MLWEEWALLREWSVFESERGVRTCSVVCELWWRWGTIEQDALPLRNAYSLVARL